MKKLYEDEDVHKDEDKFRDVYIKLPGNEEFETMLAESNGKIVNAHTLYFPADGNTTVILTPGGRGALEIYKEHEYPSGHLVPSSLIPHFQEQGINVILIHSGEYPLPWLINVVFAKIPGLVLNDRFNLSKDWLANHASFNLQRALHATHTISKEIRRSVDSCNGPVWLMGQCSSNYLMARHYHHFQQKSPVDGIIFSAVNSPLTQLGKYYKDYYTRCNFFKKHEPVTVPFHIIHHELDISSNTDIPTCQLILDQFKFTKETSLNVVSGGWNEGHPKFNFGHHGFRGIEKEVANLATNLMN